MSFFLACKYKKLINALGKFKLHIKEGSKHTGAKCLKNGRKTTIPRHSDVKREIVKKICDFLLEKDVKKEEIEKELK